MADINTTTTEHHEVPSFEPWLRVMTAALIPIVLAFVLPRSFILFLFAAAGVLLVAGLVMWIKHERAAKARVGP